MTSEERRWALLAAAPKLPSLVEAWTVELEKGGFLCETPSSCMSHLPASLSSSHGP